jgi:hypothetical protein
MGKLKIERSGGTVGFGPNSYVKSSGEKPISALSAEDQAAVETMFRQFTNERPKLPYPAAFIYHITRTVNGKEQTVQVPEPAVPPSLRDSVKDELK